MKKLLFIAIAWLPLALSAQEISSTRLMNDIRYLSSEELGGRWPGTKGDSLTQQYVLQVFKDAGLKPFGNDYLQSFKIMTGTRTGSGNLFIYRNDTLKPEIDFMPLSFTCDTTLCAPVVFAGYGIDSEQYSDFKKNDIRGKWAVIRYDIPSEIIAKVTTSLTLRARSVNCYEKGAAGVIIVYEGEHSFPKKFSERSYSSMKIPVVAVRHAVLKKILSPADAALTEVKYSGKTRKFSDGYTFCITTDIEPVEVTTANVTGFIPGTDPVLSDEYIIIGGHHDHLGMGGSGSSSRKPDVTAIHPGADDNASGTTGVLELARYYSQHPQKRSMVFSAFAAEEQGLLGSKYFTENPPVNLSQVSVMVNFDMIGRMKADKKTLSISASGSSAEGDSILKMYEDTTRFKVLSRKGAGGGSDHAPFYRKQVPVFFFITGMHEDYHAPTDTWEKIDSAGMAFVLEYAIKVISDIADRPAKLKYTAADTKNEGDNRQRGGKSIGITPDFSDSSGKGLKVEAVRKEGPAEKAGIKKDDIIVSVNGKNVTGIQDYMIHLGNAKDGSKAVIGVLRNENGSEKKIKLKVQL
jgi:Zn-dependent M28 family amino/carboxypeptidase